MDMQNVAKLNISEGEVRTIHDKDGNLIWGRVNYSVRYKGDTAQAGAPTPSTPVAVQTVTGEQTISINGAAHTVNLGSIELCGIGTYQDYIYKSGGKWYVHKEVGHDIRTCSINGIAQNQSAGDTTASYSGAFCIINSFWGNDYSTTAGVARLSEVLGVYQEQALSGNGAANSMVDGTFCQRSGTNDRVYFRNTAYIGKTGNEIKAIIGANGGTSLWWPLATPTDTEITNAALVAQLNTVEQLLTRYGYNATVSGNLPIIIDRTAL